MSDGGNASSCASEQDLKGRIFAAFEHACRYGEVEVADDLLAIINAKWMKPVRAKQHQTPGAPQGSGTMRPLMTSR